jgi:ParB-like chromosome segregation protein Spo0J
MVRGEKFPRLVLFQDKKGRYWLADGFHRFQAAVELKRTAIECIVYQGELRDAILSAAPMPHATVAHQR